jgi:hypothetical protein
MQCPSCQFENMPGSSHCARCAASLSLGSADIDINPPRASAIERRLPVRSLASARRGLGSSRSLLGSVFGLSRPQTSFHGSWWEYLLLVVPGLHQLWHGESSRGKLFFGGFAIIALVTIIFAGTGPGSMLLGILFAWHVVATVDVIARNFVTPSDRIRLTVIVAIGLAVGFYLPSGWLLQRLATPVSIALPMRDFNAGDVVWYSQSADLTAGDLVLYEVPMTRASLRNVNLYNTVYQIEGDRINRLVAVAGQTVRIDGSGTLLVDGQPSPWQPSAGCILPVERDILVRPKYVFILPENLLPGRALQLKPEIALSLAMIHRDRVRGPLLGRTFPPSRARIY